MNQFIANASDLAAKVLSAAEERRLAKRIQAGDLAARDQMITANLRLVTRIARSYVGYRYLGSLTFTDLIAEGNLGLIHAVEYYDVTKNTRFATYARYWIHLTIQRALINQGPTVRIPVYLYAMIAKWRRITKQLSHDHRPSDTEVAATAKIPLKNIKQIKLVADRLTLHEYDTTDSTLLCNLGACTGGDYQQDEIDELRRHLKCLPPRLQDILKMRFGLDGCAIITLKEIGQRYGYSKERIRQLQVEGLARLAKIMMN